MGLRAIIATVIGLVFWIGLGVTITDAAWKGNISKKQDEKISESVGQAFGVALPAQDGLR